MRRGASLLASALAIVSIDAGVLGAPAGIETPAVQRCANLTTSGTHSWPDASMRIVTSALIDAGPYTAPATPARPHPETISLPEHCEVIGAMQERAGVGGQRYAIKFHLRLPTRWNDRFLFQGGAGSDGVLGDALGPTSNTTPPALSQGYAVVSEDSGHDNAINSDPTHGGDVAFGFDPLARANYGGTSLKAVADAAKAIIRVYYGQAPRHAYFVGCSKGGQEGMVFAQRYPEEFDGILASAPGFSLPRAALAEAWDVKAINAIVAPPGASKDALPRFSNAFAAADLKLAADAVLAVCDADDGIQDGMIGNYPACTTGRVLPALMKLTCQAAKLPTCLSAEQIHALTRMFEGPHDTKGTPLYSPWQWDAGMAAPGWRLWKLGIPERHIPALNVSLGGASLAAVFTTPPTAINADLQSTWEYQSGFDFDRDAPKIYARNAEFARSAWTDIAARSANLDVFRARGGKLIVPHGVSDPVFSVLDTLAWYREVDGGTHGRADRFVRVFPVPGMNHCGGGPSTDRYDAFGALKEWVERGVAPDRIPASAGDDSPWPGRTRPLCPYPKTARYDGHGGIDSAMSFVCR